MNRDSTVTLALIGLASTIMLEGCGAGTVPANDFSSLNNVQSSDPEIANTAAASLRASRASANAHPQMRAKGSVMGPGAPDTNGRASQERETGR